MELLKGLLINLLFILILILLANMFLWNKNKSLSIAYRKIDLFFIGAMQIFICILLSVPTGKGFVYDLRFIPFLLFGLYGGKRVTIGLALILILIRIPMGGDGVIVTILLTGASAGVILLMSPRYLTKSLKMKITIVSILSFVYSVLGYLIPSLLYGFDNYTYYIYAVTLVISTFFVSYLLETLRTAHVLQLESIKYEKMEIVSHLAASISHEVRNPLTAVKGFLQLIVEHQNTDKDVKVYASFAIEETTRATEIINDYLMFAKPHPEEVVYMKIGQEITKCKEILQPLAIMQDVEFECVFLHSGKIKGDSHKFHQVLINLFKNSIEAMPNGGKISILTLEDKEKIHIHIADAGMGMKPEVIARLGEPYFSLKEQKGTGLGMMVVFKIVESMNGIVKVTSEVNVGTSITLSFPSNL